MVFCSCCVLRGGAEIVSYSSISWLKEPLIFSGIYPSVKNDVTSGIRTMELQNAFLHVWELMSVYSDPNKIR